MQQPLRVSELFRSHRAIAGLAMFVALASAMPAQEALGQTMTLSTHALSFSSTAATPTPPKQTIFIKNTGSSTLSGVAAGAVTYGPGEPGGWLNPAPVSFNSLAPGDSTPEDVIANSGSLPAATYHATYLITNTNGTNRSDSVTVTFVVAGPTMALSKNALTFNSTSANPNPAPDFITIRNSGSSRLTDLQAGPVTYTGGAATGWLSNAQPASLNLVPGDSTREPISVNVGDLPMGTYTATYAITNSNATNRSETVTVTLTVAGPTMGLSTKTLSFSSSSATPVPPAQTITITNTGSSILAGLSAGPVTYGAGASGWLNNGPPTVSRLTPGGVAQEPVSVNSSGLSVGSYSATYQLFNSNATNRSETITVTIMVGPPALTLAATSATFSGVAGTGTQPVQGIAITNTGGGRLDLAIGAPEYTAGQPTGWLGVNLSSATAPATLNLQPNLTTLAAGTYTAKVLVTSNSPQVSGSPQTVTVTLNVTAAPVIVLSANTLNFNAPSSTATPAAQSISVTNGGPGTLSLGVGTPTYGAGQPTGWLTAALSAPSAPSTLSVQTSPAGLPTGTYTATVPVTSTSPGVPNSPQTVSVTLTVGAPPAIVLAATTATLTAVAGNPGDAPQSIAITNGGNGTLALALGAPTYAAGQPTGWLTATLSGAAAPSTVSLQASATALPAGSYSATLPVTSNTPGVVNSPQTITVSLTVSTAPVIALSATAASFKGGAGGPPPAAQTIAVTNSGGGTLALAVGAPSYSSGQPAGWLTATLSSASAPATLTLQPSLTGLAAGTYTAVVPVTSSSTGVTNSPQSVTVTLVVGVAPTIALATTSISFKAVTGTAAPAAQSVGITNSGGGSLALAVGAPTYTAGQPTGWLTATLSGAAAPASLSLQPNLTGLAVGTYTALVSVTSSTAGVTNSPQSVTVTLTIEGAPGLVLATTTASFSAVAGTASPVAQTIAITNGAAGSLALTLGAPRYTAGTPTGWLTASLSANTAPSTLTLQPSFTGLGAGTYVAAVQVSSTSPGAVNSPQDVIVTLQIAEPALKLVIESLLGTSTLAPGTLQYLDARGNADGVFNLGDILAYLDRTNQTISSSTLAALLQATGTSLERTAPVAKDHP